MSGHSFWCHCRLCAVADALLTLWESVRVVLFALAIGWLLGAVLFAVAR